MQILQNNFKSHDNSNSLESYPGELSVNNTVRSYVHSLTAKRQWHELNPDLICNRDTVPAVVYDFYTELINTEKKCPAYLDLLEFFGYKRETGMGYIYAWRMFECQKHGRNFYFPEVSCGYYSPFKKWRSIKSSSSRTLRKLESVDWFEDIMDFVLTFPIEVDKNPTNELLCWMVYENFIHKLQKLEYFGGKLFATANLHPWATSNPLENHWHIHSMIVAGLISKHNRHYQLSLPLAPHILHQIKNLWASCVNEIFNTNYETLDVHLAYIPIGDKRRILHKLKYMKRRPLVDMAEYYTKHDFVANFNVEFVHYLLDYKNNTKCFGEWTNLSHYVNRQVSKNNNICPCCGSDMTYLGQVSQLPEHFEVIKVTRQHKYLSLEVRSYKK
jgi:hypothetical protein